MTWLLTDEEFASASEAIRVGDVTPALFAFLHRLTRGVTLTGLLPRAMSPTGQWDEEAVDEVLQGWLAETLLAGGLLRSFHRCTSPRELSRYLERALKNWLISKSRSRGLPRLLSRAQRILAERPIYRKFIDAVTTTAQWWGLADWQSPDMFQGSDSDLVSAAFSVGDIAVLRYGPESAIADPVVSTADLERLVTGVFRQVGALLTLRHLDTAFRGRFAPWFEESSQPIELLDDAAPSPRPMSTLEAEGVAVRAIAALSKRQLLVLRDRFEGDMTLDALARRHSISRGTADNELKRALAAIRVHLMDDPDLETVVEKIFEIAFMDDGESDD